MKVHKVQLTERQATLIRVALLQRMDRVKLKLDQKLNTPEQLKIMQTSYDDMWAMLVADSGVLSLQSLNSADIISLANSRKKKA